MNDERYLELTEAEVQEVKKEAASRLGICKKHNDIIGTQVFYILQQYSRTLFYPLGKENVWGFTRISGKNRMGMEEKPFVSINTSIPVDCQVMAAAHELYHIWNRNKEDIISEDCVENLTEDRNEMKANRFASEFLVEEDLLRKELGIHGVKPEKVTEKETLMLSELFSVPYKTMVKRLREIDYISRSASRRLLSISDEELVVLRKRYGFKEQKADERVYMDNLPDLSLTAYERGLITYERLEYLLGMGGLKPEELGVTRPESHTPPTDEELDEIME